MAVLNLTKSTTVAQLKKEFNETFGVVLRIYSGRSQAEETVTLGELGLSNEGTFECRSSLTVVRFIERMQNEFGLKVKVYTCDDWVAALDGLTLESAGKVKKNAVKADMESMIAYQRTEEVEVASEENNIAIKKSASYGEYIINIAEDNKVSVLKNGVACDDATKVVLREIANLAGFTVESSWNTQQFGSKLVNFINSSSSSAPQKIEKVSVVETKIIEVENPATKAELEELRKELEAANKAKAELEKLKAETERQKAEAEAEAAKAEKARLKAEADKKKAEEEAEKARLVAEKETQNDAKPAKSKSNAGELPGVFSVGANKKVRFSQGRLQFNPAKYEFRFAKNQYEVIGEGNKKVAPNYDGWIDIFGWGTSGYMGCQPTEISKNASDYGPKEGGLTGANANYDWGVYNPITNGGNKEGLWRTPTADEWRYLMNQRPNADKLKVKCTVCDIMGYFILPDDFWNNRLRLPLDITASDCSVNKYTAEQWSQLEALGVVFMPEALYRGKYGYGTMSWIWTSSVRSSQEAEIDAGCNYKYFGLPVRLIKDIK